MTRRTHRPAGPAALFAARARAGAVIAVAALATAACGSSAPRHSTRPAATLVTEPVAEAIVQTIETQRHVVTSVVCPRHPPRRAGVRFVCMARLAVGAYPVDVVEVNARGGVRYSNDAPLRTLDSWTVELAIRQAIRKQRRMHSTVVCPTPVLEQAGLSFTCIAKTKKGSAPFVVTEADSSGRVTFVGR